MENVTGAISKSRRQLPSAVPNPYDVAQFITDAEGLATLSPRPPVTLQAPSVDDSTTDAHGDPQWL